MSRKPLEEYKPKQYTMLLGGKNTYLQSEYFYTIMDFQIQVQDLIEDFMFFKYSLDLARKKKMVDSYKKVQTIKQSSMLQNSHMTQTMVKMHIEKYQSKKSGD